MFRGISAVNLDAKGRLAVPAKYRDRLMQECDGRLVVTIDTETNCLLLYPLPEWELIERKLQSLPSFNAQARRIQRLLIGHATDIDMDSQGRVLLPPLLRDYGALDKRVVLIGQGKKFEIWDEAQWHEGRDRWLAAQSNAGDDMPEAMQDLAL